MESFRHQNKDLFTEIKAVKKWVIRKGKKLKKYVCPEKGYDLDKPGGKRCVKVSAGKQMKKERQAKKTAKKSKAKRPRKVKSRQKRRDLSLTLDDSLSEGNELESSFNTDSDSEEEPRVRSKFGDCNTCFQPLTSWDYCGRAVCTFKSCLTCVDKYKNNLELCECESDEDLDYMYDV